MTVAKLKISGEIHIAPKIGVRHVQCFLLFWAISLAFAMRVNFSLGMVAMTDKASANEEFEDYEWSEEIKSLLLSGFFWGYVSTQVLGGYLARRFGGKTMLGGSICISSLLSFVSPLCVRIGDWKFLFAVRIVQGISQGVLFPSTHTLLAKWTPSQELAKLGSFTYSGSQFGTVAMFMAGGVIAASTLGWPGLFYIPGGLGIIWCICWYFWGASTPQTSKLIAASERMYIKNSISNGNDNQAAHLYKTPWLKFFTSLPFWSLLVVHSAFNWFFWTMLMQIPAYMKNILGFNMKENALLSALPYFAQLLLNIILPFLSTWLTGRKLLSITKSRKLFNTIAMWPPAAALVWLGYVDATNTKLAIALLVVSIALGAACNMGFMINHIDLSPNFAGVLLGCTNMIANVMGILAPLTVGFVVSDATNPLQWRIVFFISAGVCFFGNLLFLFCGSAKLQPWNEPELILVGNCDTDFIKKTAEEDNKSKELKDILSA